MYQQIRGSDTRYCNVVIDNGENTLKGFSVENVASFIEAIRGNLPKGTLLQDKMPF